MCMMRAPVPWGLNIFNAWVPTYLRVTLFQWFFFQYCKVISSFRLSFGSFFSLFSSSPLRSASPFPSPLQNHHLNTQVQHYAQRHSITVRLQWYNRVKVTITAVDTRQWLLLFSLSPPSLSSSFGTPLGFVLSAFAFTTSLSVIFTPFSTLAASLLLFLL